MGDLTQCLAMLALANHEVAYFARINIRHHESVKRKLATNRLGPLDEEERALLYAALGAMSGLASVHLCNYNLYLRERDGEALEEGETDGQ